MPKNPHVSADVLKVVTTAFETVFLWYPRRCQKFDTTAFFYPAGSQKVDTTAFFYPAGSQKVDTVVSVNSFFCFTSQVPKKFTLQPLFYPTGAQKDVCAECGLQRLLAGHQQDES